MASAHKVLSPEQVKESFRLKGETITEWAAKNGFRRSAVYRVLNGQDKAKYGQSHIIAVKLGLKPSMAA